MKKILSLCFLCVLLAMPACAQTTNAPRLRSATGGYDTNALAFIKRAGITDEFQKARINRLVVELKAANLWTNLDALYPFIGSGSNSCAQNLVSTNWPITWAGALSFTAKGVSGNGTNGWGDTGYLQSTRGALTNNFHLYAWTETSPLQSTNGPIIANAQGGSYGGLSLFRIGSERYVAGYQLDNTSGATPLTTNGNAIVIRSDNSTIALMSDGILATSVISSAAATPTNSVRILGNLPPAGLQPPLAGYSLATVHAASFGRSMTASQATNYFAIMNRYASFAPLTPSRASSLATTNAPRLRTP